jgi:iron complex transport system substrate-binding protein
MDVHRIDRGPGALALAGLAWLLAAAMACAASAASAAPAAPADGPVILRDDRGQAVALPAGGAVPQRIVTLMPSLTETVCALGACGRLVGTDRFSDWPAAVRELPKLGGLEDTQVERLLRLKPDLVLSPGSTRAVDRLQALGLRVLVLEPQSLADTERVLRVVAQALGEPAAAAVLWQRLQRRIAAAAARVPAATRGQRVYLEVAASPFAAGEASFVGELLAQLGLGNVVPAALGSFPSLNPEFVLRAQPDIVIASQRGLASMASRPGWSSLRALQAGRSCGLAPVDWDSLVRPGPRLADAAEALAACIAGLPPAGASLRP